jgi:hypothetical protein
MRPACEKRAAHGWNVRCNAAIMVTARPRRAGIRAARESVALAQQPPASFSFAGGIQPDFISVCG